MGLPKAGYNNQPQGELHHAAKLTARKVKWIRKMHQKKGLCLRCCATMLGVSYTSVWDAAQYVTWKHVKD